MDQTTNPGRYCVYCRVKRAFVMGQCSHCDHRLGGGCNCPYCDRGATDPNAPTLNAPPDWNGDIRDWRDDPPTNS